ncbi:hypothetical protein ACFSUD_07335 [Sulfitobacter aestuarii]|uniref:Uncharacterized protein n=1 Tax=Sulfitobacter aestuarii TaxID=2161676 RepID=A0ABW5U1W4_9RHOB
MQSIHNSYRSLSLLMVLNLDRVWFGATLVLALALGAWLGQS